MTRYSQKNFKNELQRLENRINDVSQKVPRQKFRFKRRKKQEFFTNKEEIKLTDEALEIKGIINRKNETITLTQEDLDHNYKLENIDSCTVVMSGTVKM